jgi:3-deoxy-manno-octulosonate cytidylyltransferase (CMP-KDO synthetase)
MDGKTASGNRRIVGFVPARAASTRFPDKPLADICGKPMIVRVVERCKKCEILEDVYVATDSQSIHQSVVRHGLNAIMTSEDHLSGTDRVAEAASKIGLDPDDLVVNIQGDQPLVESTMLIEVLQPLLDDPTVPMSTLIYEIVRDSEIDDPNAVKTVFDKDGFALYFSRATIPFFRNSSGGLRYYKHHGIYAYRNDFLQLFRYLPHRTLEKAESLEQLRTLENCYRIKVVLTEKDSIEVDTQQDLDRVRRIYSEKMI